MRIKPNYHDMGLSSCMGEKLRKEVERQLIRDLNYYFIENDVLKFDWSDCCIEGKFLRYLDGSLENFSGILLFNKDDQLVADGWMDFVYTKEQDRLIVYWQFLDIYVEDKVWQVKSQPGIPAHLIYLLENKE